jgi:hypothetical protein
MASVLNDDECAVFKFTTAFRKNLPDVSGHRVGCKPDEPLVPEMNNIMSFHPKGPNRTQ